MHCPQHRAFMHRLVVRLLDMLLLRPKHSAHSHIQGKTRKDAVNRSLGWCAQAFILPVLIWALNK